jgi:hypothetical protein
MDGLESALRVDAVCVPRSQHPTAEALEIRMVQGEADQRPADAAATKVLIHNNVADPGESRFVRDHTQVADLTPAVVSPDDERGVPSRLFHSFSSNTGAPIAGRKPPVDSLEVNTIQRVVQFYAVTIRNQQLSLQRFRVRRAHASDHTFQTVANSSSRSADWASTSAWRLLP